MKPTSKFSLVYTTENELGFTTSESSDNTPNTSPRSVRQLPVWGKRHAQMERVQPMRQLPCRVHLSCGSCSYGDSCVFLHDTRLNCLADFAPIPYVPRGKNKSSGATDGLYWPTMSMQDVMALQDSRGMPDINQPYLVPKGAGHDGSVARPPPSCASTRSKQAVFSAWSWFTLFLESQHHANANPAEGLLDVSGNLSATSTSRQYQLFPVEPPSAAQNRMTGRPRLTVFRQLAMATHADSGVGL